MKTRNQNFTAMVLTAITILALGISGCGGKKSSKSRIATAPTPTCVNGVCQPVPGGSILMRAAGVALMDQNFALVLDINVPNGNPTPYLNNGQYVGGYNGDVVAASGFMHAVNPNNTNLCLPLDGDYDITTNTAGSINNWDIFYSIGLDLRHRQTGQVTKAWIDGGFIRPLSPAIALPIGQFQYGLYSKMFVQIPNPFCAPGIDLTFGF